MSILRPITPGAWLAIMLSAVLATIAVRAINPWLLLVAFALFVPVVLSQMMRPDLASVSVDLRSPERMVVGEPVEQVLTVRNEGRRLLPGFAILYECRNLAPIHLAVPPLAPGDQARLTFARTPVQRGYSDGYDLHLYALAPFGMASHSRTISSEAELVVHPARVPATALGSGGPSTNDVADRLLSAGAEPHGLREWRHGDERRHVNWRATARQAALGPERLIVVVPEPEVQARLVLAITGSPEHESWEELLALAAWSVCQAVRHHADVTLLAAGAGPWTGTDEQQILDWFSRLNGADALPDPGSVRVLREAVLDARSMPGTVVVEASTTPFGLHRSGRG